MGDTPGRYSFPLCVEPSICELLDAFNFSPAWIKGFVDNVAVVLHSPDIHTLTEQEQEAIHKALDFGERNSLKFGAEKTEMVVFTCKWLKISSLPHLQMRVPD